MKQEQLDQHNESYQASLPAPDENRRDAYLHMVQWLKMHAEMTEANKASDNPASPESPPADPEHQPNDPD